jgi:hypothetical protein
MTKDDFGDDGVAGPPRPFRSRPKRVKIHRHSQRTIIEFDGPYGPIQIDSTATITVEIVEDVLPPRRFDDGFTPPSLRRLPKARKR